MDRKEIKEYIKIILIIALIVVPVRHFVFQPFLVQGQSMDPNLQSGEYLIVDELSYRLDDPKRGDIIVFNSPVQGVKYIKRIIGLPGETVKIEKGIVYIKEKGSNSFKKIKENYLNLSYTPGEITVSLGEDEYFVLGDNRENSFDSRQWGVLKRDRIIGRALISLWPPQKVGIIKNPFTEQ